MRLHRIGVAGLGLVLLSPTACDLIEPDAPDVMLSDDQLRDIVRELLPELVDVRPASLGGDYGGLDEPLPRDALSARGQRESEYLEVWLTTKTDEDYVGLAGLRIDWEVFELVEPGEHQVFVAEDLIDVSGCTGFEPGDWTCGVAEQTELWATLDPVDPTVVHYRFASDFGRAGVLRGSFSTHARPSRLH